MERERGPVEILCKEIEFRFDRYMESEAIYVAFVAMLVRSVAQIRTRTSQTVIAGIPTIVATSHPMPNPTIQRKFCAALTP